MKTPGRVHGGWGLRRGVIVDRPARGCSSMVEQQPSKLNTRVRFPSPAPAIATCARSGRLDAGAVGDALFLEPASVGDRGCIGAGWNFRARLQRQQRGALVFKD